MNSNEWLKIQINRRMKRKYKTSDCSDWPTIWSDERSTQRLIRIRWPTMSSRVDSSSHSRQLLFSKLCFHSELLVNRGLNWRFLSLFLQLGWILSELRIFLSQHSNWLVFGSVEQRTGNLVIIVVGHRHRRGRGAALSPLLAVVEAQVVAELPSRPGAAQSIAHLISNCKETRQSFDNESLWVDKPRDWWSSREWKLWFLELIVSIRW